jgi:ribosomal protein L16/L10AE
MSVTYNPTKMVRPETRGVDISFGQYALKAVTQARITSNQIEAARKACVVLRYLHEVLLRELDV